MRKSKEKKESATMKELFSSKTSKAGSLSLAMTAVVLVIVVIINLAVAALPSKYTSFDFTSDGDYTITAQTTDLLASLEDDITIYLIVEAGSEDTMISGLIDQYAAASKRITVKTVDPIVNPAFAAKYTEEKVSSNSAVVVCGDRFKYVGSQDMYEYEMDYSTYSYNTTGFSGENLITNAIDFVTSDDLPTVYTLSGHGEKQLDTSFASALTKANYNTASFSLISSDGIPEDADCIAIVSPSSDFSEADVAALEGYVTDGGRLLLAADGINAEAFPNLYALLGFYGIEPVDGTIIETDTNMCFQSYTWLLPEIATHDITSGIAGNNYYILFPGTQGAVLSENPRDTLLVEALLSTSEKAYSRKTLTENDSVTKREDDIAGPFKLAVAVTDTAASGAEGKLVYFSGTAFMTANADAYVSGANSAMFVNAFGWLTGKESSVTIPSKNLSMEPLTIPEATANMLKISFIFIIPLVLLLAGVIIWARRRTR